MTNGRQAAIKVAIGRSACVARGFCFLIAGMLSCVESQESQGRGSPEVGPRPEEMVRSGRVSDDHEPLIDFEQQDDWAVEVAGGAATFGRSREQRIWGDFTGKLSYHGSAAGASVIVRPAKPVRIPNAFSAVNLWVWNNYWKWENDNGKPMARMSVLLETTGGKSFEIPFNRELDWPGWYLLHVRLPDNQAREFADGGRFAGFKLDNCRRNEEQAVFLDNLSFYQEDLMPVSHEILPRPGIDLAPGQDLGVHTGDKRLPFPTREETVLPENGCKNHQTELVRDDDVYIFRYSGDDGVLEYRYRPNHGDLGDLTARWLKGSSGAIRPMAGGGVKLKLNDQVNGLLDERFGTYIASQPVADQPSRTELISCRQTGESLEAKWNVSRGPQSAVVAYVFRIWQKSLVIDVHCLGGEVAEVSLGKVCDAVAPRLISVPFWVGRPKVLLMGPGDEPCFLTSFVDHYRTGSSQLYFENGAKKEDDVFCGGGTRYLPKTDGRRNDCHERLFLTMSPRFEETLPTIPNPPSRWRSEAAKNLVCYYAVKDRAADYLHWKKIARHGMTKIIMLDWETCWRDRAESFTFRTRAAPGQGGDENLQEYIGKVQALGLRYALYNNYVDFAPVNALWNEDLLNRMPGGGWQQAWFRCYTAKPARAVGLSRAMTTVMQEKFHPTAGGPDVHTAVTPWSRVDYDARMPGAGTMLTQYYSYGQLLLEQQDIWNGPVYSECDNNYYYSGLVTGSGALDHHYDLENKPWLVDFYLRKMQPVSCNWSLEDEARTTGDCDRFLAKTIAFGLPGGFLGGRRHDLDGVMIRGYYMLQQLQSSYCQALIKEIHYANQSGELLDTSPAITTGAHERSQIRLVYDNGLMVWINGNKVDTWKTPAADLPPSGYYAKNSDGSLVVFSALANGARADYVHSPEYDYVDGRGSWMKTPWAASDGKLIVLKRKDGSRELIPFGTDHFAVALDRKPKTTTALDMDGVETGAATGTFLSGWYHIQPVAGATSYLLNF